MSVIERHHRPERSLPWLHDGTMAVMSWRDPITEYVGEPMASPYLERFWLPILGPTSTWLLRHLDRQLEEQPDGVVLAVVDVARALGVSPVADDSGHVARAMRRCVVFGLMKPVGAVMAVRRWAPPLSNRSIQSLPPPTRAAYRQWISDRNGDQRAASRRR